MGMSLEQWRTDVGYNPWHFWQLAGSVAPVTSACNTTVREYPWMIGNTADAIGRKDIRDAIDTAHYKIAERIGYFLTPTYTEETIPFPRYPAPQYFRRGYGDSSGRWISIKAKYGKLIAAGIAKGTLIEDAAVVMSDVDGDGVNDTFTLSVTTTDITDISQVGVFFTSTDRFDGSDYDENDKWKISPVRASISGGVVTITGRAWQIVKPVNYEKVQQLDMADTAVFATELSVYKLEIDASQETYDTASAVLLWESRPYPNYGDWTVCYSDPANVYYALARLTLRDAENGIFGIGEAYKQDDGTWIAVPEHCFLDGRSSPPDRVIIRYYSGERFDTSRGWVGKVGSNAEGILTPLATAEMAKRICACEKASAIIDQWQFDMARTVGAGNEGYALVSQEQINNPLGTRRGQIEAWRRTKYARKLTGFSV